MNYGKGLNLRETVSHYRTYKHEFKLLDKEIHGSSWDSRERILSLDLRVWWLKGRSLEILVRAIVIYCLVLLAFKTVVAIYEEFQLWRFLGYYKWSFLSPRAFLYGSLSGAIAGSVSIVGVFALGANISKNSAIFRPVEFANAAYPSSGGEIFVVPAIAAAVLYGLVYLSDQEQAFSLWQVALAAALAGFWVNNACEKYDNAVHVAIHGTIARGEGVRRYYL